MKRSKLLLLVCCLVVFSLLLPSLSKVHAEDKGEPAIDPLITITGPESFPNIQKGTEGKFEYKLPKIIGYEDIEVKGTVKFFPIDSKVLKVDEAGNYKALSTGHELLGYSFEVSEETVKEVKEKYGKDLAILEPAYAFDIYVVDDKNISEIKLTDDSFVDELKLEQGKVYQFEMDDSVSGIKMQRNVSFESSNNDYLYKNSDPKLFSARRSGNVELTCKISLADGEYERLKKLYPNVKDIEKEAVKTVKVKIVPSKERAEVLRLYNPNSGEHFYTVSFDERDSLVAAGWKDEGLGWYAPTSGNPVYRVYNPNAGDHHFTMSEAEVNNLVKEGWKNEGLAFYSVKADNYPSCNIYREYNPNALAGAHNFTTSEEEDKNLEKAGWKCEGVAFRGTYAGSVNDMMEIYLDW